MGFLDDAKKKLGDAVDKHGDKISEGLDKAGREIDERTGGKHRANIDAGVGRAKKALDDLDGQRDDLPPSTSTPTAGPHQPDDDPSPVPPEPGSDPNEDIASGTRPVPSGGSGQ